MARRTTIGIKKRSSGIFLLIAAVFACVVLTLFNYNTIKVVSSINAYLSGESKYAKSQKEGVRHLMTYVVFEDPDEYKLFLKHIAAPTNTGQGFHSLMNSSSDSLIIDYFSKGNNHPDEIEDVIWLYRGFGHYPFMKNAIDIWWEADSLINELIILGVEIENSIPLASSQSDSLLKLNFFNKINAVSQELTRREIKFSEVMVTASRKSSRVLFWVNAIIITLMLAVVVAFSNMLIYKLENSQIELELTNAGLIATSDKLSNFINATSHNLKAPINNMQGLINIMRMKETADPLDISLRDKMSTSISILSYNINRIEQLMNIDSTPDMNGEWINLNELLFQIMEENRDFIEDGNVSILISFKIEEIFYSPSGLKEVFSNLISNAVKFANPGRSATLTISSFRQSEFNVIRFSDNGLGMDLSLKESDIFGLFKRYHKDLSGPGVGLYLVKQIVERNGGIIKVKSKIGEGTVFDIFLQKI